MQTSPLPHKLIHVTAAIAMLFLCTVCGACHGDGGESARIKTLVSNIDQGSDKGGKLNLTPSVLELVDIGMPAVPAVLPLMLAENDVTRERAATVLYRATIKRYGWVAGRGWPSEEAHEEHRRLWHSLGDLDWRADRSSRERSVRLWQEWLEQG